MQVEHAHGELVTRECILVLTGALVWAPRHPWAFSTGPGIESSGLGITIGRRLGARLGASHSGSPVTPWRQAVRPGESALR
jgi:hypothetical protein